MVPTGIKAKLIAIQDKVATFEEEFMPYLVTDTGETLAERMLPSVREAATHHRRLALPAFIHTTPAEES